MSSRSLSVSTQVLGLVGCLLAAFSAAAVGAVASVDAPQFYAQLSKPSWAPPPWLFGPVWSALYALMGVAAWLVWRSPGPKAIALSLFTAQLAANALWSWLFFAWHLGALAAVGGAGAPRAYRGYASCVLAHVPRSSNPPVALSP